ncbi:MAG: sporulation protein [Pseudoflavonifractor sp.]|nr:sporulation protein [Pseudoflavonifractor sp.]
MDILSALGAGFLFALACNLDTVMAAVGHGARGNRLGPRAALILAFLTTGITFLSLCMGALGAALLPAGLAERLGGLALTALGFWYLLDTLRGKSDDTPSDEKTGWVALSAALAVNNAGVGVAAGVTGLSPLLASACNFVVTLAALALGRKLGERLARWSRLALPLSGLLLVVLGLWQLA